ncbi:MAG: 50S ribosomal protein L31 [Candidatus Pacebacteria bacterium]|nr:50S ribosomal protein L31 [Candidatus Paceibacterota bacterium]
MKKKIHPKYNECNVKCVCGNTFITKSTLTEINVEVCGACHPAYTGKQKIVDSTGRVERFQKMISKKGSKTVKSKTEKRAKKSEKKIEAKSKIENDTEKKNKK